MEKTIDYYMNLPYTIELQHDPEEGWFVCVKELRGCMSEGDTAEEAIAMIREAMQLWLEVALEEGIPIPEPRPEEDYSGKFVVRVSRSLHRELVENAEREGVSLNQYINVVLARSVGRELPASPALAEKLGWPGLKAAVRQTLLAAGLTEEAGELDERLFADFMERLIAHVESAIQGSYFRDALGALDAVILALRPVIHKSPVLAVLHRTVTLMYDQVETVAQLQKGIVVETMLRSRITDLVRGSALVEDATRSLSIEFSRASTELPEAVYEESKREIPEHLFGRPVRVTRW